jgi:hypothetical protein
MICKKPPGKGKKDIFSNFKYLSISLSKRQAPDSASLSTLTGLRPVLIEFEDMP